MKNSSDIAKYIFEIGTLKRIHRKWNKLEGVQVHESVADHTFRSAILGYILAKMEGADAEKVLKMCLFHESGEARIGDMDKVTQRYIDKNNAELSAAKDQLEALPKELGNEIFLLIQEMFERKTKEAIIAKDTDILELMFQAKEYADSGYQCCTYWIERGEKLLKTKSAKKLAKELKKIKATQWWKGLQKWD